jgi:hypothetical protein
MTEPILFTNTMFETANEAFLFCKDDLEKKGHVFAATHLESCGPVYNAVTGRLALDALHAVQPVCAYADIAINAVERALRF